MIGQDKALTPEIDVELRNMANMLSSHDMAMQNGFETVTGEVFAKHLTELPEGFEPNNLYSVPAYEIVRIGEDEIYNTLRSLFLTIGYKGVEREVNNLKFKIRLANDSRNSRTAE